MIEHNYIEELKKFSSWKDLPALEKVCESIEADSLNEVETRRKFETAIQICGMDIMLGSTIFKHYLDFEVEEHADLVETESSITSLKESKERIIHIIHRQLGLPLIGNEIALQDISLNILSECFSESDEKLINPKLIQQKYQSSIEKRTARMIFEEKLFPDDDDDDDHDDENNNHHLEEQVERKEYMKKLDIWKAYIKFELSEKEFSRTQRLYDRALIQCPDCSELYMDYFEFAIKIVKNWKLVESIGDKIIHNSSGGTCCDGIKSKPIMWHYYLLSIEINNPSSSSSSSVWTHWKSSLADTNISTNLQSVPAPSVADTATTTTAATENIDMIGPNFTPTAQTETTTTTTTTSNNQKYQKIKSIMYQGICTPNLPAPDDYLDMQFYACDYLCRQLRVLMMEYTVMISTTTVMADSTSSMLTDNHRDGSEDVIKSKDSINIHNCSSVSSRSTINDSSSNNNNNSSNNINGSTNSSNNNNNNNNTNNNTLANDRKSIADKLRVEMTLCLHDVFNMLTVYYSDWAAGWLSYYKYAVYVEELIFQFLSINISSSSSDNSMSSNNHGDNMSNMYNIDTTDQLMSFGSTKASNRKLNKNTNTANTANNTNSSISNTLSQEHQNGREIWEQAVMKYSAYSFIWLEYIHWILNCNTTSTTCYLPIISTNATTTPTPPPPPPPTTTTTTTGTITNAANAATSSSFKPSTLENRYVTNYIYNHNLQIAWCLKLYKRALAAVTDNNTIELAKEWLHCARQRGSVDDVVYTLYHVQKVLYPVSSPSPTSTSTSTSTSEKRVDSVVPNKSGKSNSNKNKGASSSIDDTSTFSASVSFNNNTCTTTTSTTTTIATNKLLNSKKRALAGDEQRLQLHHHHQQQQQQDDDDGDDGTEVLPVKKKLKSVSFYDDTTIELSDGGDYTSSLSLSSSSSSSSSSREGLGMKSPNTSSSISSSATSTTASAGSASSSSSSAPPSSSSASSSSSSSSSVATLTGYKVFMKNLPFTAAEEDIRYHFINSFSSSSSSSSSSMTPSLTLEQQFQLQQQQEEEEQQERIACDINSEVTKKSNNNNNNNNTSRSSNSNNNNNNDDDEEDIVSNIHLVLSKAGKSRGIAIVEFNQFIYYQKALRLHNLPFHMKIKNKDQVERRPVSIEPLTQQCLEMNFLTYLLGSGSSSDNNNNNMNQPVTSSSSSSSSTTTVVHHPTTVFVSKLSKTVTNPDLIEMFTGCGEVIEARVAMDKKTGESKCHGLVQFSSEAGKKAALALNKHAFHNSAISVLPSKFPAIVENLHASTITSNTTTTTTTTNSAAASTTVTTANANNMDIIHDTPESAAVAPVAAAVVPNKYLMTDTSGTGGAANMNKPKSKSKLSLGTSSSSSSSSVLAFKPRTFNK